MFEQIKNTVKIRLYARKFILFKLGSEFLRFYFNYMRSKRNIKLENYYEWISQPHNKYRFLFAIQKNDIAMID